MNRPASVSIGNFVTRIGMLWPSSGMSCVRTWGRRVVRTIVSPSAMTAAVSGGQSSMSVLPSQSAVNRSGNISTRRSFA